VRGGRVPSIHRVIRPADVTITLTTAKDSHSTELPQVDLLIAAEGSLELQVPYSEWH
jgi:hypothetical protein